MDADKPTHAIWNPVFRREDERGTFCEVLNGTDRWATLTHGRMRAGAVMGNHYHQRTTVFFYLLEGRATVVVKALASGERQQFELGPEQGLLLHPMQSHVIRYEANSTFVLMKDRPYDPSAPDTYHHPVEES